VRQWSSFDFCKWDSRILRPVLFTDWDEELTVNWSRTRWHSN